MAHLAGIVIGERIVTPSALVHLVVRLRIVPPSSEESNGKAKEGSGEVIADVKAEEGFLKSAKDAEEMPEGADALSAAHAPHWPAVSFSFTSR